MKKLASLLAFITLILSLSLASCKKSQSNHDPNYSAQQNEKMTPEQAIVGKWDCVFSTTHEDENGIYKVTLDGTSDYGSNGIVMTNFTYTISVQYTSGDLEGVILDLVYDYKTRSSYELSDDILNETPKDVELTFVRASSNLEDSEAEEELIGLARQSAEEDKQTYYEPEMYHIMSISNKKMVLKDNDGVIMEYYRHQ